MMRNSPSQVGVLAADEKVLQDRPDSFIIMGELSLDGSLQQVKGVLSGALEITKIHSVAGKIDDNSPLMTERPFRSTHHTLSDVEFSI